MTYLGIKQYFKTSSTSQVSNKMLSDLYQIVQYGQKIYDLVRERKKVGFVNFHSKILKDKLRLKETNKMLLKGLPTFQK